MCFDFTVDLVMGIFLLLNVGITDKVLFCIFLGVVQIVLPFLRYSEMIFLTEIRLRLDVITISGMCISTPVFIRYSKSFQS